MKRRALSLRVNGGALLLLVVFCLSQTAAGASAGDDIYGRRPVEGFADHLFNGGDYNRAWLEYQRAGFAGPPSDTIAYKAGVALRLSGDGERAALWFRSSGLDCGPTDLHRYSLYQVCYSWLQAGRPDSAAVFVGRECSEATGRTEADVAYLRGSAKLAGGDWMGARGDFAKLRTGTRSDGMLLASARLDSIAMAAEAHPWKSPLTARLLSALVPGLGRVYAGRPSDAFSSFVSVVGSGWVAHRSFERDGSESLSGWAYSALSLAFYLGEIYGAGESAAGTNRSIEDSYRARGISVFMSYHPHGIGLRGEFSFPTTGN